MGWLDYVSPRTQLRLDEAKRKRDEEEARQRFRQVESRIPSRPALRPTSNVPAFGPWATGYNRGTNRPQIFADRRSGVYDESGNLVWGAGMPVPEPPKPPSLGYVGGQGLPPGRVPIGDVTIGQGWNPLSVGYRQRVESGEIVRLPPTSDLENQLAYLDWAKTEGIRYPDVPRTLMTLGEAEQLSGGKHMEGALRPLARMALASPMDIPSVEAATNQLPPFIREATQMSLSSITPASLLGAYGVAGRLAPAIKMTTQGAIAAGLGEMIGKGAEDYLGAPSYTSDVAAGVAGMYGGPGQAWTPDWMQRGLASYRRGVTENFAAAAGMAGRTALADVGGVRIPEPTSVGLATGGQRGHTGLANLGGGGTGAPVGNRVHGGVGGVGGSGSPGLASLQEPELGPLNFSRNQQDVASASRTLWKPGAVTQLPGVKQALSTVSPAVQHVKNVLARNVDVARRASQMSRAGFRGRADAMLSEPYERLQQALKNHPPVYIGPESNPYKGVGTPSANWLKDIGDNGSNYYQMSPEFKQAAREWDIANRRVVNLAREYGVDVTPWKSDVPDSFYVPTVEAKAKPDSILDALMASYDSPPVSPGSSVTKTRSWESASARTAANPDFVAETDFAKLHQYHVDSLAGAAERKTFNLGSGGKTLAVVKEETHPGLRARRDDLAKRTTNLGRRVDTAIRNLKTATKEAGRIGTRVARFTDQQATLIAAWQDAVTQHKPTVSLLRDAITATKRRLNTLKRTAAAAGKRDAKIAGKLQTLTAEERRLQAAIRRAEDRLGRKLAAWSDTDASSPAARELMQEIRAAGTRFDDLDRMATGVRGRIEDTELESAAARTEAESADAILARHQSQATTEIRTWEGLADSGEASIRNLMGDIRILGGKIRALQDLAKSPNARAAAAEAALPDLAAQYARLEAQLAEVRAAYANAKPGNYVMAKNNLHYPPDVAAAVNNALRTQVQPAWADGIMSVIAAHNQAVLSGDASPFFLQSVIKTGANVLFHPYTAKDTIPAMLRQAFSAKEIQRIMKEEIADVTEYARWRGVPIEDVLGEFTEAGRGIDKIPGLRRFNRHMYSIEVVVDYNHWKANRDLLLRTNPGKHPDIAASEATHGALSAINVAERGGSKLAGRMERLPFTSLSFFTAPARLLKDATSGVAKLGMTGDWQKLQGREQLAILQTLSLVASASAVGIPSYLMEGKSVEDTLKDFYDPNNKRFFSLNLGNGRYVPMLGPFRGFVKAMMPKDVEGVPVPFAGMPTYMENRTTASYRLIKGTVTDRDYYGRPIRTGDFPENIARGLWYALESAAPISWGAASRGVRTGESVGDTMMDVAGGLAGQNIGGPSLSERRKERIAALLKEDEDLAQFAGLDLWELPDDAWAAVKDDPEVQRLSADIDEGQRGRLEERQLGQDKITAMRTEFNQAEDDELKRVETGEITIDDWRDMAHDNAIKLAATKDLLFEGMEFPTEEARTKVEAAVNAYHAVDPAEYRDGAVFDGKEYAEAQNAALAGLTPEEKRIALQSIERNMSDAKRREKAAWRLFDTAPVQYQYANGTPLEREDAELLDEFRTEVADALKKLSDENVVGVPKDLVEEELARQHGKPWLAKWAAAVRKDPAALTSQNYVDFLAENEGELKLFLPWLYDAQWRKELLGEEMIEFTGGRPAPPKPPSSPKPPSPWDIQEQEFYRGVIQESLSR